MLLRRAKRVKKANPNRKTKKEPNQDDPKTVLDTHRADLPNSAAPPRTTFGRPNRHQNGTKNDQKLKRKIKRKK